MTRTIDEINLSNGKEPQMIAVVVPAKMHSTLEARNFDHFVLVGFEGKDAKRATLVFAAEVEQVLMAAEMINELSNRVQEKVHPDVVGRAILKVILDTEGIPENAPSGGDSPEGTTEEGSNA